jgi:hypothetical protein
MLDPGSPISTTISPPRKLGVHGLSLWEFIQSEYRIEDPGGQELLLQCCESADRIGALSERISADGEIIHVMDRGRIQRCGRSWPIGNSFVEHWSA